MDHPSYVAALLAAALLLASVAGAQTTGTCEPVQADAYLDIGNVRARIPNNGMLFWSPGFRGQDHYDVPKGSGVNGTFTHSLWIGGLVDGEIRVAASTYGPAEFWPGPLDQDGRPPLDCGAFDRLYEIRRSDIEVFERRGEFVERLHDWPHHLGAPVSDGDGNPANYNLSGGDRPAVLGDQMLWWIMNDAGNEHERFGTKPIGIEVRGSAYAFDVSGTVGTSTFYRYRLVYNGSEPPRVRLK